MSRHTRRMTGLAAVSAAALAVGGCASGEPEAAPQPTKTDSSAWFAQNCPAQVAPVREADPATQRPLGQPVGTALVQGAIRPPAALGASAETIRYLRFDEMADELVPAGQVQADDLICFEQGLRAPDRRLDSDTPVRGAGWVGGEHFTQVRTPQHPDGVWIDWKFPGVESAPGAFMVGDAGAACPGDWSAALDVTPVTDGTTEKEGIIPLNVTTAEDC
jgi:hypothetical protein